MARTTRSRTAKTAAPETGAAEPATIASDAAPLSSVGDDPVSSPVPSVETTMDGMEPDHLPAPEPAPVQEAPAQPHMARDAAPELEPDRLPDPEPSPAPRPAPAATPVRRDPPAPLAPPPVQRVGFAPLVLGGVIAAGLGFGAAYIWQRDAAAAQRADIAAQAQQIETLQASLADLPEPYDPAPLTDRLDQAALTLTELDTRLTAQLNGIDARLNAVELAPNSDGTLSDTAIAAWQRELEDLRAEITVQQDRMRELAAVASAELDQTRSEAASVEKDAAEAAAAATARAALSRVQAALDSGTPFDAALGDLGLVVDIPQALSAVAAEGVPTVTALQSAFPEAARSALAVARSEGLAGEEGGGLAAFLRNQFDVRSVTPQEGDTTDAILSRAEEALRQNRLTDAMAEVAALPEVVRAEMADWTSAAETRAAALAAAEGLTLSLSEN